MKNFTTVLKIAPAFLLASTMIHAQTDSTAKEKKIEEVVLIGYGKQKKSDVTGSITSVTAKDFNGGATSAGQLIQGKTPGVQITNNSGAPGSGTAIRIRGTASLNGNNSPLIVIDGVPQDFVGVNGVSDPLSLINPNDIETFDILKDASATAIYGNRATNGVILITTKKGTTGRFRVNFSTVASISSKMGNVDVLNADEFRSFVNTYASDAYKAKLGNSNTNWQDLIYQDAWGTDNNVAFSGGIKGLPYRLSVGYNEQNGIVRTNSFRRTSVGLNLNPKFFDNHLSVNISTKGTFTDNRFVDGGIIKSATYFDPTQPIYSGNSDYGGYYEWLLNGGLNVNANANPLATMLANHDVSSVLRGLGNVQLDYKFHFLPDLHFNVNAGYDYTKSEGQKKVDARYKSGFNDKGSANLYTMEKKSKLLETYFNYVKNISAINTGIDLTAGYSYQDFITSIPGATTYRGVEPFITVGNNFETQNTLISFYGRAIFTIANKYIISGSLRRDGSSRFFNGTRDNLWGNFPGVSVAWKLSEESFIKNIASISTLKLRAGWGKTGQQELPALDGNKPFNYPAYAAYNPSGVGAGYQFGNQFYFMYRPNIYNPNLTWETTTTKNIGLDYGFLNNRITGSIDLFRKDTEDLLVNTNIAAGDLSNQNLLNVGNMKNSGIEGSITVIPVKNEKTTWEVSFNATHYKPEITKLLDRADATFNIPVGGIEGGSGNTIQAHAVGYAPNAFWVYQQVYDGSGKPVDGVYVDRNNDGIINTLDKYYYKSTTPDAILGFSTKLSVKEWDFGLSARAVLGNYVYNNAASNSSLQSASTNEYLQNVYSTAPVYQFQVPQYFSDLYIENASFLRLDNVNVGYNFGEVFTKGSNLKVYAMAQNVFVISKYSGIDPEVFGGIDNGYYQMPRIYSLGFNFQF
ncbi:MULTISPECIES: SusC/RagA family TonB-linked outer membrane protein [Chryseobacterium]|uniref:Iron complex outermembrane receptor protein n=1 Tax=Chryseobacterium geocarposphaerae TaxID=1416776 RepID=A0ABU1L9H2_9FLAO|nr:MULTISPECIES: SusC/RagA family TonB-linked outer membrane protein [Chryseobacterium]MDR6403363.1 iron complex outermembrane receptor protein [Chryseobacterium geocarposphaerae]MDR6696917.1 iron complex outermembrane receptor protein [Chryseobacterium ginsenosidimutans]